MCEAFFVPHIYAKFYVPAALGFFVAAKFNPPRFGCMSLAGSKTALAVCLIIGFFPAYAVALAAQHLAVAAAAVHRVSGGKRLWNIGGSEFCVFWTLCWRWWPCNPDHCQVEQCAGDGELHGFSRHAICACTTGKTSHAPRRIISAATYRIMTRPR